MPCGRASAPAEAVVLGAMVYRESLRPSKLICLAIIIIGMIGLRLTS